MKAVNKKVSMLLSLSLTILFFSGSCHDNDESKNKQIVVADNAKYMEKDDWQASIVSMDSASQTFVFDSNLAPFNLDTGDILVSDVGEGVLRTITEINQVNGQYTVKTSQAAITDLIQEGSIELETPLTVSDIRSIEYNYDGIQLDPSCLKKPNETQFAWNIKSVLYDHDGNSATTSDQLRLEGTLNCDWNIFVKIDISFFQGLKEVNCGFSSSENLNLRLVAGLEYSLERNITLFTINFTPITVMVGPVPVVFTPQLKVKAGIDGYANASVTSEISQSLSFNAGMKYVKNQGWSTYKTLNKSFSFTPPQLNMNVGAGFFIKPELTVKIYGVVGPYANMKLYGRIEADLMQTPWWKIYCGLNMGAGAKAEVFSKVLFDINVSDLLSYETIIAQAAVPPAVAPTVTTSSVTGITPTTASGGGNVTAKGSSSVTARGVCWNTSQNPTTANAKTTNGTGTGSFTSSITGLSPNTTYYVRAYATNSAGTSYGSQVSFKTNAAPAAPTVTTASIGDITTTTASGGGNVTSDGGASVTVRGVCWSASPNPTTANSKTTNGTGTGSFTSAITGLSPNTTYYVRAYATNSAGTGYGSQVSFTSNIAGSAPTVTTVSITNIDSTTAAGGGNVISDGGFSVTARGICWSASQNPTVSDNHTNNGSGSGAFTSAMTGLSPGTKYYVRAYATNSVGTSYGSQVSFSTTTSLLFGTFTDPRDGRVYKTVTLGTQTWMAENLNFRPSTGNSWYYNNDSAAYSAAYGRLYDWNTALAVAPPGWHLPSDEEWTILTAYLGGESVAGGKLKETGTVHWNSPNTGATDEISFTALPGGYRYFNGAFFNMGGNGYWWTSSDNYTSFAWYREMSDGNAYMYRSSNNKIYGFSIRCVRD